MGTTSQLRASGLLRVYALEVHAVQHCNLRCVGCAQSSPTLAKGYEQPAILERALANLAPHLACEKLQILGGEPLLHPRIVDILTVAVRSGLAPKTVVKTNGLLLHRVPDGFWNLANEVIVSVYPTTQDVLSRRRPQLQRSATAHGVELIFRHFAEFQEIIAPVASRDEVRTQRVYTDCEFKAFTHSIRDGRVYRCAPSVNLVRGRKDLEEHDSLDVLGAEDLQARLQAFLISPRPLRTCAECLGSSGAAFSHVMSARADQPGAQL